MNLFLHIIWQTFSLVISLICLLTVYTVHISENAISWGVVLAGNHPPPPYSFFLNEVAHITVTLSDPLLAGT